MSTLDVSTARLRAAVARFPLVRDVRASASVPHGLRITVSEQQPVAALVAAGQRTAVAADGVVLGPALLSGKLPTLSLGSAPAPGRALPAGWARDALELLGAAPAALARAAARVYTGSKGISISFRSGLVAYFGDSARAHAKWLALALVTSGERASGASYVDVRVPERPAAGFPSGVAPPPANASGESSASESLSASESSASIAAALRLAGGEGSATAAGEGRGSGEASNGSGESSSERSSGESGEASGTAGEAREAPRSQAGEGAEAGH
jgi:cell division protein FtsQ